MTMKIIQAGVSRSNLVFLLVVISLTVTGCGDSPVDNAILEGILAYFVTLKGLQFTIAAVRQSRGRRLSSRIASRMAERDRHRGFFVWRRAAFLGERNSSWVEEANQTTLKARIESEYTEVEAYLTRKIGTQSSPGPLLPVLGGSGDVDPPHLDLADVARRKVSERASSRTVRRRARRFTNLRKERVIAIVWRAAALHDELWQPAADNRTATLRQADMDEILARRLRAVERMNFNVASAGALGGRGRWRLTGNRGPWQDSFRVRMFEYPRIPNTSRFRSVIGSGNIASEGSPAYIPLPGESAPREWLVARVGSRRTRLEYNIPPSPGLMLRSTLRPHWRQNPSNTYRVQLVPESGRTAAQVIDDLFTPNNDWWQRSWLFCDHVIAALNIEALLFGKRRRDGNDTTFNQIISGNAPGYVSLYAFVGRGSPVDNNVLMADDDDPFFSNTVVPQSDLEVGDQLIFWNSFIYDLITNGDWRLENALVMDVDSTPSGGNVDLAKLSLQGHGTGQKRYSNYRDEIASKLRPAMVQVRNQIRMEVGSNPSVTIIPWNNTRLVKWSPYEAFTRVRNWQRGSPRFLDLGAWWIEVPLSHGRWNDIEQAVQAMPKAVGHIGHLLSSDEIAFSFVNRVNGSVESQKLDIAAGYREPPDTDKVYFPVFEPRLRFNDLRGWAAYLTRRGADATFSPISLQFIRVDGQLMPGLFPLGPEVDISVVRPATQP